MPRDFITIERLSQAWKTSVQQKRGTTRLSIKKDVALAEGLEKGQPIATLKTIDDKLYVDDHEVLKGWESVTGWYWFGTEKSHTQDSEVDGRMIKDDQIWFGYVQGQFEEWGYFSQGELDTYRMRNLVWPIRDEDLPFSGRR